MEIIVNSVRTVWKYNGIRTRILKAKQTEEEKKKRRNDSRFNQKTRWKDNSERNEKKNSLLLCSAWIFASANRPSKSKLAPSHNSPFAIYILAAICLCNFYQSLHFGDGDKKRRNCNLLVQLLFVFAELSGTWCVPHASLFIQKLTYLSKNDFNMVALFRYTQKLWQTFSAMHLMWFTHWHAKDNI